jgi:hypothetical protein
MSGAELTPWCIKVWASAASVAGATPFSSGIAEEFESFKGDFSGGPIVGDSSTTFVGVAFTRNERSGESTTFVGDGVAGCLLTGDSTGPELFAGDKLIIGSWEIRLLRRRVDRLLICVSSICTVASTGSADAGTSNSIKGCKSATIQTSFSSFGSIGQREL